MNEIHEGGRQEIFVLALRALSGIAPILLSGRAFEPGLQQRTIDRLERLYIGHFPGKTIKVVVC
jgi:hypothetical protein